MVAIVSLILVCLSLTASAFAPVPFGQANFGTASLSISLAFQDNELSNVRRLDREGRGADGALAQLTPAEHIRRAGVYLTNRAFMEARAHFQTLIERFPNDMNVPAALYGTGRSYSQVRRHEEALPYFERVARDYAQT